MHLDSTYSIAQVVILCGQYGRFSFSRLDCEQSPFPLHWSCSERGRGRCVENVFSPPFSPRSLHNQWREKGDCSQSIVLDIVEPPVTILDVRLRWSLTGSCHHRRHTTNSTALERAEHVYATFIQGPVYMEKNYPRHWKRKLRSWVWTGTFYGDRNTSPWLNWNIWY